MPQLYARLHRRFAGSSGISRREMIQRSLAATAGLLLSEQFSGRAGAQGKPGRVVVIGAGFSGLTAAYELSRAGYVVTVIEARNRPFIFATGYGTQGLPPEFRNRPALQKPLQIETLANMVEQALKGTTAA